MAMVDDNSGGQRRRRMTKAADDNSTRDRAADYNGEGEEWAANKQRQDKRLISTMGREREKKKFMQKNFFQQYGLSGWIFCSHKNSQCALFALSVLYISPPIMVGLTYFQVKKMIVHVLAIHFAF